MSDTVDQYAQRATEGSYGIADQHPAAEPIAIVGIGCRFPGANGPAAFWQALCDGADAIREVPADRFDINAIYDPRPSTPGKLNTRQGGFLDHIDHFDAAFFGIAPREAKKMDPQQRLLLEVSWEAVEDAGLTRERLLDSPTGVFVGLCYGDYEDLQMYLHEAADIDIYAATGSARSVVAGRVSYVLGLRGPSVTVDTACSSSLVALHLACQSLRGRECRVALAAGVNLVLLPEQSLGFAQAGMLAPDGRCKAFDARGDGFVRSDGLGVVVLKPLADALADNDTVYAVIRGSAVNNDGRSSGLLMTPGVPGQEAVLRAAYRSAGVAPGLVQYVETHGTGTRVGDPVEAEALGRVLAEGRAAGQPCAIGSVKTNIGHTEGAAGIAGVIKVALALKHGLIPPSLHCTEPNPAIPWETLPLTVQRTLASWPEGPHYAGVSSFGISGTNAHVVLEEAPWPADRGPQAAGRQRFVFPLSAHTPESLREQARLLHNDLARREAGAAVDPRDLAYTLGRRRTAQEHRLAVVAPSIPALEAALDDWLVGAPCPSLISGLAQAGRAPVVFVFPGQGGQWVGMSRQLMAEAPVFRAALEACDQALRPYTGWSLLEQLAAERMTAIDVIQPAVFAVQVALAALWRAWGIEPDAVIGHSMGEVAASCVAGALSLDDAARVIALRSQLLTRICGQGAMASVELSRADAARAIAGYEDRVAIAVCNSPTATVLSGDPQALGEILALLAEQDVFCRLINVDVASHSPQVDPLLVELGGLLEGLKPRAGRIPIYSTVTGALSDGTDFDGAYWIRNLREPVQFWGAVEQAVAAQTGAFIELSPHPLLLHAVRQCVQQYALDTLALPSLRRDEDELGVLLGSLGALFVRGYAVNWAALSPDGAPVAALPPYPWQHERFWLESKPADPSTAHSARRTHEGHPMIGTGVSLADRAGSYLWEYTLDTRCYPYIDDHRVQDTVVLPGTAYLEMALAAVAQARDGAPCSLVDVTYHEALFLPPDVKRRVQVRIADGDGGMAFWVYSREIVQPAAPWTLHATGRISPSAPERPALALTEGRRTEIQQRCSEALEGELFYRLTAAMGNQWGPAFQGIARLWRCPGEALAELHIPAAISAEVARYLFHPALLDASGQVLAATVALSAGDGREENAFVLGSIGRVTVYDRPAARMWSHILPGAGRQDDVLEGDIQVFDDNGNVIVEVIGLQLKYLDPCDRVELPADQSDWLYRVDWVPHAPALDAPPRQSGGRWLLLVDEGEHADHLAGLLRQRGAQCTLAFPGAAYRRLADDRYSIQPSSPADLRRLLDEAFPDLPPQDVVHLWSLSATQAAPATPAELEAAQLCGCVSAVYLVQALAQAGWHQPPRLWLVTQNAQAAGPQTEGLSCAQAPLWGLGRALRREQPELRSTLIDLAPGDLRAAIDELCDELWFAGDAEDQIALRHAQRYVPRLLRYTPPAEQLADERRTREHDQPFALEIPRPGILDHLGWHAAGRPAPRAGEIEIAVRAAGLNFRDVMLAMGVYPGQEPGAQPLGWECAGVVTAVGPGVQGFAVGDEVMAIANPSLRSFAVTPAAFAVPKPAGLSFDEAVTLPITYLTAYYALHHLARLQPGERVLIHAAAGGVGLAAVQIARWLGAEVFATAGSPDKRAYLRSIGVPHVMDSRSLDFADEVRAATGGAGVDVVLNSLAGPALPASLALLARYGRFVEIGKKDILEDSRLGMRPFERNTSFFAVDVVQMLGERPAVIGGLLRQIARLVEQGALSPLPRQVFPVGQVAEAFRTMAQAKHIGKLVISFAEAPALVAPPIPEPIRIGGDGTYLITGGLGGIGLVTARWLAEQGARSLALLGRSVLPPRESWDAVPADSRTGQQIGAVRAIEALGARVSLVAADVADEARMRAALETLAAAGAPPVRGVFHAAGVVTYQPVLEVTAADLQGLFGAKVQGSWVLHRLFEGAPLDCFVLFSSGSSLLSSPLLGGYAAANAFLDALAQHRRALGLPCNSINWGFWDEVGMVARYQQEEGRDLVPRGMGSFAPVAGLAVLARLLRENPAQAAVMPANWQVWRRAYPAAAASPFLAALLQDDAPDARQDEQAGDSATVTRETLLGLEPDARQEPLAAQLRRQVARILGLAAEQLDVQTPLNRFGLDSLMAVELKNRVQTDLGVAVPVVKFLQGFSVTDLARHVLEHLVQTKPAPEPTQPAAPLPASDDSVSMISGGSWEEGEL